MTLKIEADDLHLLDISNDADMFVKQRLQRTPSSSVSPTSA